MGSFYDNDEAPSIFDVAMAYENGNGGIIRPKKKRWYLWNLSNSVG
jgi:hypothetical protein